MDITIATQKRESLRSAGEHPFKPGAGFFTESAMSTTSFEVAELNIYRIGTGKRNNHRYYHSNSSFNIEGYLDMKPTEF